MANEKFIPCTALPTKNDPNAKYFITKSSGGYSTAIKGNNSDGQRNKDLDTIPNCVAWALGRFFMILQDPSFSLLKAVNAEDFIKYADKSLVISQTPQVGSIIVWEGKGSLAGHVAVVEEVKSPTEIVCSESGWSAKVNFWNQLRSKGKDGNWGQNSNYKFLGFIYNPAPCCQDGSTSTNISTNTSTNTSTNISTNISTSTTTTTKTVQVAKLKDTKLSGIYTVTASDGLNLRYGAGTNYDVMVVMPKGAKVSNYGYYNAVGSVKWLYIQCVVGGKKYTGYCSSSYLKKD